MDTRDTPNTQSILQEARQDLREQLAGPQAKPDLLTWLSTSALAKAEGTTARQVYAQIDLGMPHSRIGDRIRCRRKDWHDWHERHMQGQVA